MCEWSLAVCCCSRSRRSRISISRHFFAFPPSALDGDVWPGTAGVGQPVDRCLSHVNRLVASAVTLSFIQFLFFAGRCVFICSGKDRRTLSLSDVVNDRVPFFLAAIGSQLVKKKKDLSSFAALLRAADCTVKITRASSLSTFFIRRSHTDTSDFYQRIDD